MKLSVTALCFFVISCSVAAALTATERPNIILVMADDMGWGDPSYNGGWIHTPTLDTMAASGLRFNRFYAASAVCSPTRGSCLTGRNPLRLGIPDANSGHLALDETPLSEVLDDAGYTCGHFGKWHLGTLTTLRYDANRGAPGSTAHYSAPWHHQYDTCFATESKVPTFHPMRKTVNGAAEPVDFDDSNFYGTHYWNFPADPATWDDPSGEGSAVAVTNNLSGDDSTVMMDRIIPFVQSAVSSNQPFFAVVWFHTPHKPLVDPDQLSAVDSVDAYTNAIQNMDMQIGRLRTELELLGVRTNTMLWFCSDNGPESGVGQSGGLRDRKRSLHEGGVRVPGLLEWPAVVAAARSTDYPCVSSDYYPTILDALELSVANQKPIDGISLMPLITNTVDHLTRTNPIGFIYGNDRSWVTQQYKLISKDGGVSYELYDLLADINETSDIISSEPEVAARLLLELETWVDAVDNDVEYVEPAVTTNTPAAEVLAGLIKNGDLNSEVATYGDSSGATQYYLDALDNVLMDGDVDTGVDVDTWIRTPLSRGFRYSADGGRDGTGGFMHSGSENMKPRAVIHFARDGMRTVGDADIAMEVFLQDNSGGSGDLRFYVELYGWLAAADGPRLTPGGPDADISIYNTWQTNAAVRLLESTVYATNITEAAWTAVSLGSIDLGIGYNYYAWRIGVVGANDGDQYAFDNVGVETATGYRFIPVANHSFTDASNFEFRNNSDNIAVAEADIGQWVSRESGADSSMDIADITGAAFNGDNIYAQDGDSSMLFQAKSQRALVQVVDVRAFNIAGNKLTLGAIFSARDSNPAKSAVLKMRGFNSFTGLTVDLGGDWSFTGGTFIHDYGTTTVEQNEMLGQSCMKTLSGNSPLDFDYLAIIVGGAQSTDHNLNSDWVAVDNLKLFLPPAGGSVMLVQ